MSEKSEPWIDDLSGLIRREADALIEERLNDLERIAGMADRSVPLVKLVREELKSLSSIDVPRIIDEMRAALLKVQTASSAVDLRFLDENLAKRERTFRQILGATQKEIKLISAVERQDGKLRDAQQNLELLRINRGFWKIGTWSDGDYLTQPYKVPDQLAGGTASSSRLASGLDFLLRDVRRSIPRLRVIFQLRYYRDLLRRKLWLGIVLVGIFGFAFAVYSEEIVHASILTGAGIVILLVNEIGRWASEWISETWGRNRHRHALVRGFTYLYRAFVQFAADKTLLDAVEKFLEKKQSTNGPAN